MTEHSAPIDSARGAPRSRSLRRQPWEGGVPEHAIPAYENASFRHDTGLGRSPALLIIDVQYRSVGESPMPILEAIDQYPTSCGETGWHAVEHITALLAAFRGRGLPVLYPHVAPKA